VTGDHGPQGPLHLARVSYDQLNARQKETYNFHRAAARLALYGYNSILLSDDWLGADFIAYHLNGRDFYRVQLKGRMTLDRKYLGKGLYIAFFDAERLFVYPHDEVAQAVDATAGIRDTSSWSEGGKYTWPTIPAWAQAILAPYEIGA
jgi:hypothetical protein